MDDDDWNADFVFVKKNGVVTMKPQAARRDVQKGDQSMRMGLWREPKRESGGRGSRRDSDEWSKVDLLNADWNKRNGVRRRREDVSEIGEDNDSLELELDRAEVLVGKKVNTFNKFQSGENIDQFLNSRYYKNLTFAGDKKKKEWAPLPALASLNTPKPKNKDTPCSLTLGKSFSKIQPLIPILPVKPSSHKPRVTLTITTEEASTTILSTTPPKVSKIPKPCHPRPPKPILKPSKPNPTQTLPHPLPPPLPPQPPAFQSRQPPSTNDHSKTLKKPRPQTASTRPSTAIKQTASLQKHPKISWFNGNKKTAQYQIEELIGTGAFGEVYSALDLSKSDTKVAIKMFSKRALSASDRKSIDKEVSIMGSLNHEFIVPLEDIFYDGDKVGLVMPLLKGRTVLGAITSKLVSESLANSWSRCILKALAYMHSKGIYHRDIKAENVIAYKNKAILIDFGLSIDKDDYLTSKCGTMSYMAPEMISNKLYKPGPNDIWCFGVLYYFMLVGEYPFGSNLSLT